MCWTGNSGLKLLDLQITQEPHTKFGFRTCASRQILFEGGG